jgi:GNAT superfamily N-acetyltransferase
VSVPELEKVEGRRAVKEFIRFPWSVYGNDPCWVPPLLLEMKEKLDTRKNPFFEHAEMELYLARRDGRLTGRIAAILDRNHNSFHNERVVFFGFYESFNDPETAAVLLDAVAAWGKAKGMDTLRGPMNLSMNEECAFLLEGFDSPPAVMMPYNPPYYLDLMARCGLVKAKDLYAYFATRDHRVSQKIGELADTVRRETRIVLRPVTRRSLGRDIEKIKQIYNDAWERNWGFVPWTQKEMAHMGERLKRVADTRLILLAEDEGRPVGFAFGLPNLNEAIKKINGRLTPLGFVRFLYFRKKIKGMRAVVFGILKEYRQTGLSYYLYSELEKSVIRAGYEWGEMSWQLEDNEPVNRFNQSVGGRLYKKYRIFEKKIG